MNTKTTADIIIEKAAHQYGAGPSKIESLGNGLIHRTYKVHYLSSEATAVLQCINQHTFPQPENIIHNYRLLQNELSEGEIKIPRLLITTNRKLFWIDETENFWRATEYYDGCYTAEVPADAHHASGAAACFASFVKALRHSNPEAFHIVIPSFHDLAFRAAQMEKSINNAEMKRLMKSTHVIAELRQRYKLVDFYNTIRTNKNFHLRLMHHDCKISNVLFDAETHDVVCPVDLDTTMPGYFFSDIGDLFRTVACTVDEQSTQWDQIDIKRDLYRLITRAYVEVIQGVFTTEEVKHIHNSGLIMIYMQSMRFLTDFLNNDIYYRTDYPEQNLNRALNQLILLEKLESFVKEEYDHDPYN
ncbi:MAG TPA: phosphotransferase [Flavitalea sp.]|nr:phosphotransferase [Flavitalea sp.]